MDAGSPQRRSALLRLAALLVVVGALVGAAGAAAVARVNVGNWQCAFDAWRGRHTYVPTLAGLSLGEARDVVAETSSCIRLEVAGEWACTGTRGRIVSPAATTYEQRVVRVLIARSPTVAELARINSPAGPLSPTDGTVNDNGDGKCLTPPYQIPSRR